MKNYTSADFAYLDTFTTVFAIFATYMLEKSIRKLALLGCYRFYFNLYLYK